MITKVVSQIPYNHGFQFFFLFARIPENTNMSPGDSLQMLITLGGCCSLKNNTSYPWKNTDFVLKDPQ